jgi:predicted phosphodiesterase
MPADSIVWWHLSDLHWEVRSTTERKTFLAALFGDLARRVKQFGAPDFIVMSGDITYSGEESEFLDFEEHFLARLLEVAGEGQDHRLFFVPGNHDQRRSSSKTVNAKLLLAVNSQRALTDFLDSDDLVEMVARPFSHFQKFAERMMPNVQWGTLGWSQVLSIRNHKLLISGLNSAWGSSYYLDSDGIIDDERHLFLGERQLVGLRDRQSDIELFVLIMHHPLSWLSGFNQAHIRHLITSLADVVLFGHSHTIHDLSVTLTSTGSAAYVPSPATYDRASMDSIEFARGYSVATFDCHSRSGEIHYFKYSSVFATRFTPFVELYSNESDDCFPFVLSPQKRRDQQAPRKLGFTTLSEVLDHYPDLHYIVLALEGAVDMEGIEKHALDYFDSLLLDIARDSEISDSDSLEVFWEGVILARSLILFDLQQVAQSPRHSYRPRLSVDRLMACLASLPAKPLVRQLSLDQYSGLLSITLDAGSFRAWMTPSRVSETYYRLWAFPWLLSRLVFFCDYPELIPQALASESRIATLFTSQAPEQLAILGYRFDKARAQLSLELRIHDRDGFLAVTLLKHYCDVTLRHISDLWRSSQRIFPPIGISLEFPRWRNRQIADHYLTIETTPIVKLLMGKAMYRDAKHVWFRELIQNALDANSARRSLDDEKYVSRLEITHENGNKCIIKDNGIGMSRQHILRYLTTLGRSIWSSEELYEGKPATREGAIQAIGKFGIGFAAVFQDASRVCVRTKFFRDVGEIGWLVEFSGVDKPFLLESAETLVGTEVEIILAEGLSARSFVEMASNFFLYIDENIVIKPDPVLPRSLMEAALVSSELATKAVLREHVSVQQIGAFRLTLRCLFCYDFKGRDKNERLPSSRLIVTNSGVRVFEQVSLILKPGKRYIWVTESEAGTRYEDPDDSGLKHYWVIVDFDKGASPILPSRLEIEIDPGFSRELLEIIHDQYSTGLRSVVEEISLRGSALKVKRKAILTAMTLSTLEPKSEWRDRHERRHAFSRVGAIDETVIQIYKAECPVWIKCADGSDRFEPIAALAERHGGVFVVENVEKSALFKVYARAAELAEWVVVDDHREFFLFETVVSGKEWKGFVSEKALYTEGRQVFAEAIERPLNSILRADYALISDDIFNVAGFIVLPASLPGTWRRGDASVSVRRDTSKSCPARVLVNERHPLIVAMDSYLGARSATSEQRLVLKLLLDNLCDGVVEQDRTTVARERLRSLQRDLRDLLGNLPELKYEDLVIRR